MTSGYYPTISNYSSYNGALPLLYSIRDSIPFAFAGLLFVIFIVLVMSEYFIIKNKTGRGKILTCLLSSSIVLVVLSLLLAMASLVTYITVIFYAFISIVFFAFYKLSTHY